MASELMKITDLTVRLGLSSRSLRYYEQVGLIQSIRSDFEKYRSYDSENIERLKQIMVLRKMQIPIKDIIRIYESEDMSTVVEVFVDRINAIDEETNALSELKRIVSEFLQTMIQNGITKISAIPLLYEEMDKQLNELEERKPVTAEDLTAISERLARPLEISIVELPSMRVLSSILKSDPLTSDQSDFSRYIQIAGIMPSKHERFEFQNDAGDVIIQSIPDDYENDSDYLDYTFHGGLFAAANIYLDEDLGERFRSLIKDFDENKYYQVDYTNEGNLRHPALLENLISPDDQRELVALLVPVKKRMADPSLFDKPEEVTGISIEEIEEANPILWTEDVPLGSLTPINNPHYRVNDDGEAEYTGWISTRVLNTNVSVKLPFRVDIEFRLAGVDERFGYGDCEGSVIFYHGDDPGQFEGGNFVRGFGVNMGNRANQLTQAVSFYQPIFRDFFNLPGRGAVKVGEYNRVTWIVGAKHLAVIVNGEVRYCGTSFPYMSLDLSREATRPIVIGSNGQGMKYFRSIRVSQLAETQKNKLKTGELIMITKQSNNTIPIVHRLITSEHGENYWFNGCVKYVMECLGEKDYDYEFFAGITGDVFTQHYCYKGSPMYSGDALSSYMMNENIDSKPADFVAEVFGKCGYAATYVSNHDIRKNTEMYLNTLTSYIDKGIPVITWGHLYGIFVGYEDYGKVLLYITGDNNQPERIPLEKALRGEVTDTGGWIFVGEKNENKSLAQLYRSAIVQLPHTLNIKTDAYCFGAEAFRAWAHDIESGKFDDMTNENFDAWYYHTNYVCVLATNGSCCHGFLKRAQELNPDMDFLEEISNQCRRYAQIWGGEGSGNDPDNLEALGGGFNVTLESLQDKEKRDKIATKIRECAEVTERIVGVVTEKMANEIAVCESFQYIKLGKVRFIGIDARQVKDDLVFEEDWGHLKERSSEYMNVLDGLAAKYGTDITAFCCLSHHNGHEVDTENHYLAGRFFKADTPVPEGYDYYDVPTENSAYAVYTTDQGGAFWAAYFATRDKILTDGVGIPYPHAYWHAEAYIDGNPHDGNYRFAYIFSVDEKAEGRL